MYACIDAYVDSICIWNYGGLLAFDNRYIPSAEGESTFGRDKEVLLLLKLQGNSASINNIYWSAVAWGRKGRVHLCFSYKLPAERRKCLIQISNYVWTLAQNIEICRYKKYPMCSKLLIHLSLTFLYSQ